MKTKKSKFKVGDRIVVVKDVTGEGKILGKHGVILEIGSFKYGRKRKYTHRFSVDGDSSLKWYGVASEFKLEKISPIKFALQYELEQDPTEYFTDMKDVTARIKELCDEPSLKKDRIFVHTISKTQKVKLGFSIRLSSK